MKLGILVTTDLHLEAILGIAGAALAKGHTVAIFATDTGTRLLADPRLGALGARPGAALKYCVHSAALLGVRPQGAPGAIGEGSQLDNAVMVAESDKVIVL